MGRVRVRARVSRVRVSVRALIDRYAMGSV